MSETIKKTAAHLDRERRAQNAFNISVGTGVIFVLIAAGVMIINKSARLDLSLTLVLVTALAAFVSAWLSRNGKSETGILLIIGGLLTTIIGRVFIQKGFAIPTGITNVILITTIATYTLSEKWIGRAVAASFFTTLATIVIDQYTTDVPESSLPQAGLFIALGLGLVYLIILARQFSRFKLRMKLIIGFLSLSIIPLIVLGWLTYVTSRDILQGEVKANLSEGANSTSGILEDFVTEQFDVMVSEASLPDVVSYLSLPPSERNDPEVKNRLTNILTTFILKNRFIISISLIDASGHNLLDTISVNVGAAYKDQAFFIEPIYTKKPYISNVLFSRRYSGPIIYFAAPVLNAEQQPIGVLLATYKAEALQSILQTAVKNRSSGTEYTFLIDGVNFVNLGHSSKPDLLYKSYQDLNDTALLNLQEKNLLKAGERETLLAPQPQTVEALRGIGMQTSFQAPSWENDGEQAESAAARVPNTEWIVVTSQPIDAITVLTQNQTRATVTASVATIVISAIIALLVSNIFTSPILQLTQVAEKVSAGDFTQKAIIRSQDEIGILGETLNRMTGQIQELIGTLEKRVADRTADLEQATQQSEKRTRELQTIADISRQISTEKDVEKLLPLITRTVSEQFDFYHVGIFLLNENKKFAILRAANSPGGQVMLQRQHKLEVGQTGIVGNVTASGAPRIALDTGADAVYFNNPDLPETHSEMALPLFVRGEVIGALDVQSTERNAFSTSDIFSLSVLADQIAIAIDNARLIEETQKALAESESVFHKYLADAWQNKSTSNTIGYYQTVVGGVAVTKNTFKEMETMENDKNVLALPIQLRGQNIGALNILLDKNKGELTAEQINIVKSIVERLGLALENARLFEETSTRASRERLVTDITTKIRGTNNPQEMIKTAMEELKRALGASRVEVVPKKSISLQDK